jgi:hypothetical protein
MPDFPVSPFVPRGQWQERRAPLALVSPASAPQMFCVTSMLPISLADINADNPRHLCSATTLSQQAELTDTAANRVADHARLPSLIASAKRIDARPIECNDRTESWRFSNSASHALIVAVVFAHHHLSGIAKKWMYHRPARAQLLLGPSAYAPVSGWWYQPPAAWVPPSTWIV